MSINDARVDDRPPAFGCGHSFGMLGPSRLVLSWSDFPSEYGAYAQVCLPIVDQLHDETVSIYSWKGTFNTDVECYFQLSLLYPPWALWDLDARWTHVPSLVTGSAKLELINFEWQFGAIVLPNFDGPGGNATINRIAEWQTVSERFPAAAFPDIF